MADLPGWRNNGWKFSVSNRGIAIDAQNARAAHPQLEGHRWLGVNGVFRQICWAARRALAGAGDKAQAVK